MIKNSMKKLELFLQCTSHGFALLTVNEYNQFREVNEVLQRNVDFQEYDMELVEYHTILSEIEKKTEEKLSVVFYNFLNIDEKNGELLEKFNMGRDLLLQKTEYCIFIVPLYIELYIQEYLPNLYAYFEFKARFLQKYPSYCELILPEDGYLKTKSMQRVLKQNVRSNNANIVQRLEGYLHVRVSEEEFRNIEKEVREYVNEIEDNSKYCTKELKEINDIFCCRLMVGLARVATLQSDYKKAIEIYEELLKSEQIWKSWNGKFELINGIADTYLYAEKYDNAYENYARILSVIVNDFNNNKLEENDFQDAKIRIYSKIALCEFKRNNTEKVLQYLEMTKLNLELLTEEQKKDLFPVYYNYFLMYLDIYPEKTSEADKLLDILQTYDTNAMQKAMVLTVKAWYLGIINGNLREAVEAADEALKIKRDLYIENDARIAESHYVNALLRVFQGKYEQAEHCCIKSINILKNFNFHTSQKQKSNKLLERIRSYMDNVTNK